MSDPAARTAETPDVVVIGAGPAGLTAAYQLAQARRRRPPSSRPTTMVGGISRTVERDGWRFDIGGHRFFTKVRRGRGALARDPARRGLPACGPARAASSTTASSSTTRCRPSTPSRNLGPIEAVAVRRCPTSGPASGRRRTRPTTRAGWSPASAGASTARSSRPTPRRCGACRSRRCRPTGPRSGSRTCRSARPSSTRSCRSGTRRTSPRSSRSSSTPSTAPG